MSERIVHMCLSIRGALNWPKRRLDGMFREPETGRRVPAAEAREILMDHLSQGHEVFPMCNCPDFDWKEGCPGKNVAPSNTEKPR